MRATPLLRLIGLGAGLVAGSAGAQPAPDPYARVDPIDAEVLTVPPAASPGWSFVGLTSDLSAEVLVQAIGDQTDRRVRDIWLRYEFERAGARPGSGGDLDRGRSQVVLTQVDCTGFAWRSLYLVSYAYGGMTGPATRTDPPSPAWMPEAPNTLAEQVTPIVCREGMDATDDLMLGLGPNGS